MEALALTNVSDPSFRKEIEEKYRILDPAKRSFFQTCLTCGTCAAGCCFNGAVDNMDPRKFIRKILLGLKQSTLDDIFVWNCNCCGRCTLECPMGIDMGGVVRTVRGNFGLTAPGTLQLVANTHLETGNQMGVSVEDYLDTIDWMQEELQEELGDPNFKIPMDVPDCDFLFIPHPREIKYYPEDIKTWTKIFTAAGAKWTLSSKAFDVTNFGLFNGRDDEATKIFQITVDAMRELNAKRLVCTECGHGYWAFKFGAKAWIPVDFPILHMVEYLAEILREGKIQVDKSKNTEIVTLHDPCNTVRKGGVVEEPRYVLSQVCENFVEMWPNRQYNYCCGGGGGALAMGDTIKPYRMAKGKLKAEQIRTTGAEICCAPCHNCYDQLNDINKEYQLGLKVKHIFQLVEKAMVWEYKPAE
ncbi:(Fe-S)-binding protein [Desulforudis sp. 1088]|uniref:(Fe-S)-binding protein n=1 Tax=unclassified Candidatus Desulforudis TaxID=2635950 RepID=UPI003BE171B6